MKNLCQHFVTFLPVLVIIILLFFSLALSLALVTCLLSLSLSASHLLSSFNSWCTFCDIILNPAALLCIYISVCLGMQKVLHRLYLALSPSPYLPSQHSRHRSIQFFFDTNSAAQCCLLSFSFVFAFVTVVESSSWGLCLLSCHIFCVQ